MTLPRFVDHVVLRVAELARTEHFYTSVLGQNPRRAKDSLMYQLGDTRLFLTLCNHHEQGSYDEEKIGFNHLAFGVRSLVELREIHARLVKLEIPNSGIKIDHYGQKEFIWLDDPDGLRIEFYLRPEP
jgi:glyoxylase I family protein